jgi:hypothetical protein
VTASVLDSVASALVHAGELPVLVVPRRLGNLTT